jgi:glycosyltransferase involved in cell wall biosynthesis
MLTSTRSAAGLLHAMQALYAARPELRGQLHLELVGARENANDGLVRQLGLEDSVSLRGYVPHAEAIEAMQGADVLVLIKHDDPRYRGLVPGKFYEYLGAGRPVLGLVPESEAAQLIRELHCGEVASSDDPQRIVTSLERLLAAKRSGTLSTVYRCVAPARFQRPEQARNLAALLQLLLEHREGAAS